MDATTSYREADVRGASPLRLVVCLYEQAITDLRRAAIAFAKAEVEVRTGHINHALLVIAQLQGSLDMERGKDVARNLQRFYNLVRTGLVEAQVTQSAKILEQQIEQLVIVHQAWQQLDYAAGRSHSPVVNAAQETPLHSNALNLPADWNWNA